MTVDLSTASSLTDKKTRKVWIKDGQRRMMTDSGWMNLSAKYGRKLFGNYKQGRYSQ